MPAPGYKIGRDNLRRVKRYFRDHFCATQKECAKELGLSTMAVGRYVKRIREEWNDTPQTDPI